MSNIYINEPPTNGKVVLVTSRGDIDIELWSKEAPKACRNFVQLCLEGYYDDTIFHRVIKGFIIQGGDATGTGQGGESIYGKPFGIEPHSRLRFNRRGLVGTANSNPSDNNSQFFITLDRADELNGKHTLFGKITGNTIFNVTAIAELPTDDDDRPEEPPRIKRVDVLHNPFDDLELRTTAAERRAEQEQKRKEEEKKKKRSRSKAIHNTSLVSFGEDEEGAAPVELPAKKAFKMKSSHDLLDDPKLAKKAAPSSEDDTKARRERLEKLNEQKPTASEKRRREKEEKLLALKAEAEELREQLREKKQNKAKKSKDDAKEPSAGSSFIDQQRDQYKSRGDIKKKSKSQREAETLALLNKFKSKVSQAPAAGHDEQPASSENAELPPSALRWPEDEEDDYEPEDDTWMGHMFENQVSSTPKGIDPELDPNSLDLYDPRNPLNVRRRKKQPKEKKRPR